METNMTDNFERLREWVGKKDSKQDLVTAWPLSALAATIEAQSVAAQDRAAIPPGWHWLYFLEAKPASEIGHDGHPQKGGFLPPVPLPRRMWAGGRLEFIAPLKVGDTITRESEILSVEPKSGRTGTLVFVTVRQTIFSGTEKAIVEEQDIVYREAAKKGDPLPPGKLAPASPQWSRSAMPDAVMLFRFSALTFNAHRIHYDKDYAIHEEHYSGLVVHGPLQATLLLDLCRRNSGAPVKQFEYRAQAPIFAGTRFTANGNPDATGSQADLWTADAAGNYGMRGTATF